MEAIGPITARVLEDILKPYNLSKEQIRRARLEGILQKAIERESRQSMGELKKAGYYTYPEDWIMNGGTHPYAKRIELLKCEQILRDRGEW